jgi:hypothetical protein
MSEARWTGFYRTQPSIHSLSFKGPWFKRPLISSRLIFPLPPHSFFILLYTRLYSLVCQFRRRPILPLLGSCLLLHSLPTTTRGSLPTVLRTLIASTHTYAPIPHFTRNDIWYAFVSTYGSSGIDTSARPLLTIVSRGSLRVLLEMEDRWW